MYRTSPRIGPEAGGSLNPAQDKIALKGVVLRIPAEYEAIPEHRPNLIEGDVLFTALLLSMVPVQDTLMHPHVNTDSYSSPKLTSGAWSAPVSASNGVRGEKPIRLANSTVGKVRTCVLYCCTALL